MNSAASDLSTGLNAQDLRARAEHLAAALRAPPARARTGAERDVGSAGRRREGVGESFWQYRPHRWEDGAARVDWRRSAKDDHRYYVRETELETARVYAFWLDSTPRMTWRSADDLPTKTLRGAELLGGLSVLLGRAGEICGGLGAARRGASGREGIVRVIDALVENAPFVAGQSRRSAFLLASDFLDAPAVWESRLSALAAQGPGLAVRLSDPAERAFPFKGRVRFDGSLAGVQDLLFGKTETVRDTYLERYAEQNDAINALFARFGWTLIDHGVENDALDGFLPLAEAVAELGAA